MADNGTSLLDGQSPPLAVITSTDQTGVLLIVTALGLAFALVFLLIRVYLQLEVRHSISYDDVTVGAAFVSPTHRNRRQTLDSVQVVAIFQAAAVFVAASKGFGKIMTDIPQDDLVPLQKVG